MNATFNQILCGYFICNNNYEYFRGVRPFGVSLLIAGWDEDKERPYLYQCDPSVCSVIKFTKQNYEFNIKLHFLNIAYFNIRSLY